LARKLDRTHYWWRDVAVVAQSLNTALTYLGHITPFNCLDLIIIKLV